MNDTVIQVENLSKYYRLGVVGTGTLSHDLNRTWAKLRGKPDPTLKIGQEDNNNGNEHIWALRDISFEVAQGAVLGIIGRNGAGKSTLLKILSRVTAPTSGECRVKGRIASLLEVGTGFHPELTGRENIFLNGAILGMTKDEIRAKFDEIVAFAEVEKFIDTPVKRYSSGMYVRLAFAVAAHLEPEILIVDEVLAVGDAQFQKKCLGKMGDVSKEGRTVLFVSHNMAAVHSLCTRGILLHNGSIIRTGDSYEVITSYLSSSEKYTMKGPIKSGPNELEVYTESLCGKRQNVFTIGEPIKFIMNLSVEKPIKSAAIGIGILDVMGDRVVTLHTMFQHPKPWGVKKNVRITVEWPESILNSGSYRFESALYESGQMISVWEDIGQLRVIEKDYFGTGRLPDPQVQGKIVTKAKWYIEENSR